MLKIFANVNSHYILQINAISTAVFFPHIYTEYKRKYTHIPLYLLAGSRSDKSADGRRWMYTVVVESLMEFFCKNYLHKHLFTFFFTNDADIDRTVIH